MRRLAPLLLMAVLVACGEEPTDVAGPTGSPSASPTTPSPTNGSPTPSATPSPAPRPIPPAWANPIEEDAPAAELSDEALVPPDATLTSRVELPAAGEVPDQVAVAYALGDDPFASEQGFAVWQRFPEAPAWSVVYASVNAPEDGVLGIRLDTGDLTDDGHDEVLVFEDRGGSGACGTWTVVSGTAADTSRIFRKDTCDAEIVIGDGALRLTEAVFEPDDPHCCPSAFRTSRLEWNGERFVKTEVGIEPAGATS